MFLAHCHDEVTQVFRLNRIGMVVRKPGIRVAVKPDEIDAEVFQNLGSDEAGGAIAAVQHDPQPPGAKRDLLLQHLPVGWDHLPLLQAAVPRYGLSRIGQAADRLNLVSIDGSKSMGEFEPVELRRVVAGRDHDATVDAIVNPGEIEHRRNDGANVDDVAATGPQAPHDRVPDPGRTLPVVATNNNRDPGAGIREPGAQIRRIGTGNGLSDVWGQIRADDAANVVLTEDRGVDANLHCES